jgi:nucleotide-binding universal stress UspA family protein
VARCRGWRVCHRDIARALRDFTSQRASKWLAPIAEAAEAAGVSCETVHVTDNHPWQAIIATTKARGCDLIVMASHGRRALSALVIGSETVKVLTHSTIPVLVYR